MRTISYHRPRNSPRGDTVSICDYCGVEWYRSRLRRDRSGNLACPDDVSGLDRVTLSEGNAKAAAEWKGMELVRYTGHKDITGEEHRADPRSILGSILVGWWNPGSVRAVAVDGAATAAATGENQTVDVWGNIATRYRSRVVSSDEGTDAVGTTDTLAKPSWSLVGRSDSSGDNRRPSLVTTGGRSATDPSWAATSTPGRIRWDSNQQVVNTGATPPLLPDSVLADDGVSNIGSNPCVWMVASRTDSAVNMPVIRLWRHPSSSIHRQFEFDHPAGDGGADVITGFVSYSRTGNVEVTSTFMPDSALRLYSLRAEATQLVLKVSDTEWSTSIGSTFADSVLWSVGHMRVGAEDDSDSVEGELNEIVITNGVPTAAQITALEAYFQRAYTDLDSTI